MHTTGEVEQETKAINFAYTVGGLTLAFQDAKTSNAGYVATTDDDTRTLVLKQRFNYLKLDLKKPANYSRLFFLFQIIKL